MNIQIMPDKEKMGKSAAAAGAKLIREALAKRGQANIIVATGASQFEMLAALVAEPDINWNKITGFHLDAESHWVAELDCGHNQHVRHDPPWISRPWVTTGTGRARHLGTHLGCRKCDRGEPPDRPPGP